MFNKYLLCCLIALLLSCSLHAKTYKIEIFLDCSLVSKNIIVNLDDGVHSIYVADTFKNNSIKLTGNFKTHYLTLGLLYFGKNKDIFKTYWITEKPATLYLNKAILSENALPSDTNQYRNNLINVFDFFQYNWKKLKAMNTFRKSEVDSIDLFFQNKSLNNNNKPLLDSLKRKYFKALMLNTYDFAKEKKGDYFYVYYFIDQFYVVFKRQFASDTALIREGKDYAMLLLKDNTQYTVEKKQALLI